MWKWFRIKVTGKGCVYEICAAIGKLCMDENVVVSFMLCYICINNVIVIIIIVVVVASLIHFMN
jgi:hypothetical protein